MKQDGLIRVFSGNEILVLLLQGELEAKGIFSLIKNDYQSGITAGFFGGIPSAIDLFIQESDLPQAEPLINEFLRINSDE
ncbi:MAG: DUF2007 domain-containing protein [Bacteroidales bacterium]|jgi:hypothetical protein|nr:DUF2007 domain-containing protein [Bacteroidales bacterium]